MNPTLASRYRERVARLYRGDEESGLLYVRTEPVSYLESGHLWWKRWGQPAEQFLLLTIVDGEHSDTLGPADYAEGQLEDFASGHFQRYGETFKLRWLPEAEAAHLRAAEFGR